MAGLTAAAFAQPGLALIDALQDPIDRLDWEIRQHARSDPRVKVLTQLPGVGPFTALVILAEAGDITRFGSARKLASWAGLQSRYAAITAGWPGWPCEQNDCSASEAEQRVSSHAG